MLKSGTRLRQPPSRERLRQPAEPPAAKSAGSRSPVGGTGAGAAIWSTTSPLRLIGTRLQSGTRNYRQYDVVVVTMWPNRHRESVSI